MKHFEIYQANSEHAIGSKIQFRSYKTIKDKGIKITLDAYKKVYEGELEINPLNKLPIAEQIYERFNILHPKDFKGRSLSVSDIVVIDGQQYFCDSYGFRLLSAEETETKDNGNVADIISNIIENGGIYGEVELSPNGQVNITIDWGDWKHEHAYLRYLMETNGYVETNENITDDDGSDCYSSVHTFEKVV